MNKLPLKITAQQAEYINDLRYNSLTWKEIAYIMKTSESSCRRANNWYIENVLNNALEGFPEKVQEVKYNYAVTLTSGNIFLINNDTHESRYIREESSHYEEIFSRLVDTKLQDQKVIHDCFILADAKDSIEVFSNGRLTIDVDNESITYDGKYEIPSTLTNRIINMIRDSDDGYVRLLRFMNKLLSNPSYRAVQELYSFLVFADIEISEEGNVMCYKKVTNEFKDIYSESFDNSPGTTVEMPRHLVTDDQNITCAPGLHVCAKSYLEHFGGNDTKVVKVSVDPADFVSIPTDYDNAKARVSKYIVLDEVFNI